MTDNSGRTPGAGRPGRRIDSGLWALVRVARYHRVVLDAGAIAHELGLGERTADITDIIKAARDAGLKAKLSSGQTVARLRTVPRPAILRLHDGRFVILRKIKGNRDAIVMARSTSPEPVNLEQLAAAWTGEIVLVGRAAGARDRSDIKFGFSWFTASIWRHRQPLAHVLVASLFVQMFALVTPLLFQVIIDKVLVHKSMSTLVLIAGSMTIIGIFDVSLQYLRTYALAHTSNRIDVELGTQLFRRLFQLPLSYFETRPAGQTVARVRELENIRSFLTGQGLTSVVDLLFTVVFLIALLLYSVKLGVIIGLTIPLYVLVGAIIRPLLRDRIKDRFYHGAASQQFLVESIVGAATLKSAAVEPLAGEQWEDKLAAYVRSAFRAQMLGSLGQNIITYLTRLSTVLVLYFGAQEVIAGNLTVGGLVAFNMIASQMIAPVLRLANLWQDFQQVQISVDRLGDILNSPPEPQGEGSSELEPIKGEINFRNVSFRYAPSGPAILSDVSFKVAPGEVVGIVGASGSGKSTVAKLIQRLYEAETGQISIDGQDLRQVNLAWLRRQIGVVLQENLLFNRSVHDNIALATPAMPRDEVVRIAKLAGADEFIRGLAKGYDTPIEERGANLSGGQRQRIAIARALARDPRILIFDEATSALDYESESLIQANMRKIVKGRTVIIIAHRLAAVRECDWIMGISRGKIVEAGSHEQLLERPDGLYANLWRLQGGLSRADAITA